MKKYMWDALALVLLLAWSCNKEEDFLTGNEVDVTVSTDTLRFDTVFTSIGSATRSIRIFNDKDQPVRIDRVYLENGSESPFRINVDGIPGSEVAGAEIYANDSIYVFVEVTVDPDQPLSISPFVIEENLVIESGGEQRNVLLEAWGQNANYIPSRFNKGVPVVLSCENSTVRWDDPKPYVIYGELFIDECTLNIPAGTRIYVHGGIAENDVFGVFNDGILYTLENGSLQIEGTQENPVVIQGDRLEEVFREEEGQWTGIILGPGSKNNEISYTNIKNSIFGVYVDSAAELSIKNSVINNTASSGLIGVHSQIEAENCLLYNNLANAVQLIHGGDYFFDYVTVASYGVDAVALGMSNFICYDSQLECQERSVYRMNARFRNSIFFGTKPDELILSDISGGQSAGLFNLNFQNCIVRVDELLENSDGLYADFFEEDCLNCINGQRTDVLFADPNADDYHLDSLSIADGQGRPIKAPRPIAIDLEGKIRDTDNPDIGCYERIE